MSVIRVPKALVQELRAILRDYPEINYIYEDEESIDSQLARALYEGMEDFNNIPPILNAEFSFENIPKRSRSGWRETSSSTRPATPR